MSSFLTGTASFAAAEGWAEHGSRSPLLRLEREAIPVERFACGKLRFPQWNENSLEKDGRGYPRQGALFSDDFEGDGIAKWDFCGVFAQQNP